LELPGRAKTAGVDVLWSPGYTAPFRTRCAQVVSILDMQYKRFPEDLGRIARWTTEVLVQLAARRADHLLTISEFSKREILELTRAKEKQITVTPLAVDPAFGTPVEESSRHSEPYFLCVANSYPHKNVDQLIRAYAAVQAEIPHKLVWVGRARLGENRVEEALSRVPDPGRVVRLSGLTREELIGLYQGADLFVFPSLYEGFGLPVLEALMAGTAVLTTTCGSLPEVGGRHVRTYDPSDDRNLEEALRGFDPSEASWQEGLPEWIGEFTWRHTAQVTLGALTVLQKASDS
jgi:glycosyltransferase involved in cell wall biosynthesis